MHLSRLPEDAESAGGGVHPAQPFRPSCDRRGRQARRSRWMADPMALRRVCEEAVRTLLALPADTPSLRLLADETAKVLAGMSHVLDGIGAARRCSWPTFSWRSWLPAKRARLAACPRQRGTRVHRDRCGRAFLGRHCLAERRLGDRLRRNRGAVAFAERRSCLRRLHRVRARHRRRRRLRGDHEIRGAAGPANVPGLLRRHRSFLHTSRLCPGPEPASLR